MRIDYTVSGVPKRSLLETEDRIKREKYSKGFAYRAGLQEDILEENKAVLRLIKEKEKRLS